MFETAFTLNLTQFARGLSLPERLQKTPFRNVALEGLRQRNTAIDALFYDIRNLSADEAFYISDSLAAEGAIMIVPPTGMGALILCDTVDEFLARGGRDVHVLTVAGIGGSALGAAAFARNVADAVEKPVAVVVSGYGLADAMIEVIGGSFFFGWLNSLRHPLELLDELSGQPEFGAARAKGPDAPARSSCDTRTVLALLDDPQLSFDLVVGHSKGSLLLAEAFDAMAERDPARLEALARTTRIVIFGARIALPRPLRDVIDVMGEWDWFGEMNSRVEIPADRRITGAGHHTNTELPGHLPVTATLRQILADGPPEVPKRTTGVVAIGPAPNDAGKVKTAAKTEASGRKQSPSKANKTPQPAFASLPTGNDEEQEPTTH